MSDAPKLRGHHLICLHFFSGEGYSEEFIENLGETLRQAERSGIEVADGADDVCRRCPYLNDEKCSYGENSHEEIKGMDGFALKLLNESPGNKTGWADLREKVTDIFPLWHERHCLRCGWRRACEGNSMYRELTGQKG
jgi:hypothetical protein